MCFLLGSIMFYGEVYWFVRFSKVRDVTELLYGSSDVRRRSGRSRVSKSIEMVNQVSSNTCTSLAFVNKYWEHWVVMHKNEKVVAEDV